MRSKRRLQKAEGSRAHGFIHDDPERALEFIAFVSLLAKLLDGAKRR